METPRFMVTKSFMFEAGHQLLPGCFSRKCSDCIHGHSYEVELSVGTNVLDTNLMVIDFGLLKPFIDEIIKDWDHALLLPTQIFEHYKADPNQKKVVDFGCNPTAEAIAQRIGSRLLTFIEPSHRRRVHSIRVWETKTSSAIVMF